MHSPDEGNEAERIFLTPHMDQQYYSLHQNPDVGSADNFMVVPGLADFDDEIAIYRTARDRIAALPDKKSVGWLLFDYQPIKQVPSSFVSTHGVSTTTRTLFHNA